MFDILKENAMSEHGFMAESMDIIIEDGPHDVDTQEQFLHVLFPLVKPGGFYIIEDIGWKMGTLQKWHHNYDTSLSRKTHQLLQNQDCFFVDTSMAHRNYDLWKENRMSLWGPYVQDHHKHDSWVLVIRKRKTSLRTFQMNTKVKYENITSLVTN